MAQNSSLKQYISGQWTPVVVGARGLPGLNGADGSDGKTLLYGGTNPTSQGTNGDFYINTSTYYIFGPKENNIWPAGLLLSTPIRATRTVTSSTSITTADDIVVVNAVTPVNLTLPTAIGNASKAIDIKNKSSSTVTILSINTQTIDGYTSMIINQMVQIG